MNTKSATSPPLPFRSFLAWRFTGVEDATVRIKEGTTILTNFPVLTPLPTNHVKTDPLEMEPGTAPYLFFVFDAQGRLCFISRTQAVKALRIWIRSAVDDHDKHCWAHKIRTSNCVETIAKGIQAGQGPFELRYASLVRVKTEMGIQGNLRQIHALLIDRLRPLWEGGDD